MKIYLCIFLLAAGFTAAAQPVKKVYAYAQVITPGMIRQRNIPDENGKTRPADPLSNTHYYIYTASTPGTILQYRQLWIRGRWYQVAAARAEKTPVNIEAPSAKELVPSTKLTITRIEPGDSLVQMPYRSKSLKELMKKAELIISYTWKGKSYHSSVKKITDLEKLHGQ